MHIVLRPQAVDDRRLQLSTHWLVALLYMHSGSRLHGDSIVYRKTQRVLHLLPARVLDQSHVGLAEHSVVVRLYWHCLRQRLVLVSHMHIDCALHVPASLYDKQVCLHVEEVESNIHCESLSHIVATVDAL
jgi:hypothetical protein